MAVKSILDIDLDDSKFKAFYDLFQQYQTALKDMPGDWQKVGKGTKEAGASFEAFFSGAKAWQKVMSDTEKQAKRTAESTSAMGKIWHNMVSDTRNVAVNIKEMTTQLLRWGEITGVISGLVGGGGLFGISRLAQYAAGGRFQAAGLDVNYGQNRAFAINYGRFLDNPSGTLGAVSGALHDVTSPQYTALLAAGLSPQFLATHNAAEVSAALLPRLAKRIPAGGQEGTYLKAFGLDSVISAQELNRYRNASPAERAQIEKSFQQDSKDFDQSRGTQKAWTDLSTQLDRAGTKIEEVFVTGLVPLAPAIQQLSAAVAESIKTLLSQPKLKEWIGDLAEGIKKAADFVGSDQFQKNIAAFVSGVGSVATALGKLGDWLVWVTGGMDGPTGAKPGTSNHNNNGPQWRRGYSAHTPGTWNRDYVHVGPDGKVHVNRGITPDGPVGSTAPSQDQLNRLFKNGTPNSGDYGGLQLQPMAYRIGGGGSGSGSGADMFKQAIFLLLYAADALAKEFKEVTSQAKDLADGLGILNNGDGSGGLGGGAGGTGGGGGSGGGIGGRSLRRASGGGGGDGGGTSVPGNYDGKPGGPGSASANELMNFLITKHGWTPQAAAIAAAQAYAESTFNPKAWGDRKLWNKGLTEAGTEYGSYGMFQWNRGRLAELQRFGGANWRDKGVQMEFMAREAEKMLPWWKRDSNMGDAGKIGKAYEGYAGPIQGGRSSRAEGFLRGYKPSSGLDTGGYQGVHKPPRIIIHNAPGNNANITASNMTMATG